MDITGAINRGARKVPTWLVYVVGALWVGWTFWLGVSGQLGPEPIKALEHEYGEVALQLIIAVLAITSLRKYAGINLLKFRRALGVTAFFIVVVHFTVWAVLDVQSFGRVWADIVKRPYVTIGMAGFALLIPLAITSNNRSIKRLGGAAWRRLHWLTYPAAILGGLHYIWLVKGFQIEPLIYFVVITGLLATRIRWNRMQIQR